MKKATVRYMQIAFAVAAVAVVASAAGVFNNVHFTPLSLVNPPTPTPPTQPSQAINPVTGVPIGTPQQAPSGGGGGGSVETPVTTGTIVYPANGATISISNPTINGTATSTVGVLTVKTNLDGAGFVTATGTTSWSQPTSGLSTGSHTVVAQIIDNAANTFTTPTTTFTVSGGGNPNYNTVITSISVGSNGVAVGGDVFAKSSLSRIAVNTGDGKVIVANAGASNTHVFDVISGTSVFATINNTVGQVQAPISVIYDSNSNFYYESNSGSENVRRINAATNVMNTTNLPIQGESNLVYDPVHVKVYSILFFNNALDILNALTNLQIGTTHFLESGGATAIMSRGSAWAASNGDLYIARFTSSSVAVWNTSTDTEVGSPIAVGLHPLGVTYDSDNAFVYVTNYDSNTVSVIDTGTNLIVGSPISVGVNPIGITFDSTHHKIYVANNGDSTVSMIDPLMGNAVTSIPTPHSPHTLVFNPFNGFVYIADSSSDTVSVLDANP